MNQNDRNNSGGLIGKGIYTPFRSTRIYNDSKSFKIIRCQYPIVFSILTSLLLVIIYIIILFALKKVNIPQDVAFKIETFMNLAIPVLLISLNIMVCIMWFILGSKPFLVYDKTTHTVSLPRYGRTFTQDEIVSLSPLCAQRTGERAEVAICTGPGGGLPGWKSQLHLITKDNDNSCHWLIATSLKAFDNFDYIRKHVRQNTSIKT
jgi:hypothetical protein